MNKKIMIPLLCGVITLVVLLGSFIISHPFTTEHISGLMPEMTEQEMIEKSHLIVKGTFTDKSRAFQVKPTNGGNSSNFTDYYLTVESVYRGDVTAGDVITVRTQGGSVGTLETIAEFEPDIQVGDTVFIYLYQYNFGGSYTTDENYYRILNGIDGLFHYETAETLCNPVTQEKRELNQVTKKIQQINHTTPINKNWVYEETCDSLKQNLKSGFISQKEYDQTMEELQSFATVTKKALFK